MLNWSIKKMSELYGLVSLWDGLIQDLLFFSSQKWNLYKNNITFYYNLDLDF